MAEAEAEAVGVAEALTADEVMLAETAPEEEAGQVARLACLRLTTRL